MTTTLIIGANKGLGYETARRLLATGHDVWVGARDATLGEKAAAELGARFVQLDVTSDSSVAAAVQTVGELDVLINNAGISGGWADTGDPSAADVQRVFETNVFGAVRVFHAFLPALERSANPVVVNVSSGLGSIAGTLRGDYPRTPVAYGSSKAAVNMLTVQWARAHPRLRVNVADPGYTATDLNGNSGPQTVTEGTDAIVQLAAIGPDGPTATYVNRFGAVDW
jgi:NAD(P)-dependent dehydrogenase (short-subunit alcohol dehydrogenase family)